MSSAPLWAGIVGQDQATTLLRRALAADRVAHAYAFVGPTGVGRRLTALAFAQALLCAAGGCGECSACRRVAAGRHPDCRLVAPTPPRDNPRGAPAIRIEDVRELEHWAALAPHEGPRKVFVLDDADRMTLPTAQALLKTLEEPPPRTVLILILANPRALPPTVLSRCQQVRFRPLGEEQIGRLLVDRGFDAAMARRLARRSRGQLGLALATDLAAVEEREAVALTLLQTPLARQAARLDAAGLDRDRGAVGLYLEAYWFWCRDALCLQAGAAPALLVHADREEELRAVAARVPSATLVRALAAVKDAWLALDGNVTPRLALERALLDLGALAA
jgi:DNA polymerase III subunit delta'